MLRFLLYVSLIFISVGCQESSKSSEVIDKSTQKSDQVDRELLDYEVIEKKDISFSGTPRMTYRIIINEGELPSESDMRRTAEAIWRDGNRRWSEFTAFMYMPEMSADGVAYGVAEFNRSGLTDFRVQEDALYGTKWHSREEEENQENEKKLADKETQGVGEYSISLDISKNKSRKIDISVDTNFPDGTNFLVTVEREYRQKGNSGTYSGDIFSRDVAVNNGQIDFSVEVEDTGWYSDFQKEKKEFAGMGVYSDISDISDISPEVEVKVLFSPRRDQPAHVLKSLGKNAEKVKGEGAKKTGNFTAYSVSRKVSIPFKK